MINFKTVETTVVYHADATLPDGRVVPVTFQHEREDSDYIYASPKLVDVNILENVAPYTMDDLSPLLLEEFITWKSNWRNL